MEKRVQEYTDFTSDLVTNAKQTKPLPPDYQWTHPGWPHRLASQLVYHSMKQVGRVYWHSRLHVTFSGREKLAAYRGQSYFLYGNHTQPFGDPFMPMLLTGAQRAFTLASAANLGVPFFGPILQLGGGVVLPETGAQTRRFLTYLRSLIQAGQPIAVYPEAHVWPYYTGIRPFVHGAFHYPVAFHKPVFSFTTTYQAHKTTVYIDGPFMPTVGLTAKAQREELAETVHQAMTQRAQVSTYQHIIYRRQDA